MRPEPQGLISAVVDALAWGHLHCLNVYESDRPEIRAIRKGDVKRARFLEGDPDTVAKHRELPLPSLPVARTRLLGEAPVEPDGSFFVEVPADTPFLIQLLDEKGKVLETMPRWIWVRRGTSRGCIGCHENKELAPENRVSDAVRKAVPSHSPAEEVGVLNRKDRGALYNEHEGLCRANGARLGVIPKTPASRPGLLIAAPSALDSFS